MRQFVVGGSDIEIAGASTLVFVNPPAAGNGIMGIEILRAWVGQDSVTAVAQHHVQFVSQVTAFPTLTSVTPRPLKRHAAASVIIGGTAGAAGTAGIDASAEGAGTKTEIMTWNFNNLNGWEWVAGPRDKIVFPAGSSSGFGLYLPTAPGTLTGWSFGVIYEEI